jgi:hypothetical protein
MGVWDNIQRLRRLSLVVMVSSIILPILSFTWGSLILTILASGAGALLYFIDRRKDELSAAAHEAPEIVTLRTRLQSRELSPQQEELFRTVLRETPGTFIDLESPEDAEAKKLARQLSRVLRSAGWEAGEYSIGSVYSNEPLEGIHIRVKNLEEAQPHVSLLQKAFTAIDMPVTIEVDATSLQPPIVVAVWHKPL